MTFKTILVIALVAVLPVQAMAVTPTSADIQAAYAQSVILRGKGRPDLAELILRKLIALRPNAPQLRFDLGVALAEQGKCVDAIRAFNIGEQIDKTPRFKRASALALKDTCPGLAPLETSLSFNLVYDSNANLGAGSSTLTVNGIPFTLSSDAVAQKTFGYQLSAGADYNFELTPNSYIVPSVGLGIADYQGTALDQYTFTGGLDYRHVSARTDWRIGPVVVATLGAHGLESHGAGASGRLSYTLGRQSALYVNGSYINAINPNNWNLSYRQSSLGTKLIRNLPRRNLQLRAALTWTGYRYNDISQNLQSITAELGVSGQITPKIGYDLAFDQTFNQGQHKSWFFGNVRKDRISSITGEVSFAKLEGLFGRPFIGASYTISHSTWATKTYTRTQLLFGFTNSF